MCCVSIDSPASRSLHELLVKSLLVLQFSSLSMLHIHGLHGY